jgi:hypothetical protein
MRVASGDDDPNVVLVISSDGVQRTRIAGVFGRPPTCVYADMNRLKSNEATLRREFVLRDQHRTNQLCRCLPRWRASELGTTRGGRDRARAE